MLLISSLWYSIWGLDNRSPAGLTNRVLTLTILNCTLLSINSLINISGDICLLNNYYLWSPLGGLLESFTYILSILWLRKEGVKVLSLLGIVLLLYINDYISLFITIEGQVLILYILGSRDSISSGIKYFIIGSLSSALIILGITFIYSETGITTLGLCDTTGTLLIWGKRLIIVGLLIKLGIPPFHLWNIDIMDYSRLDLTAWFGIISKIGIIYVLSRLGNDIINWDIFIILCFIFGSILGLMQVRIKRLLAYSGVVQLGFLILGLKSITTETSTLIGYENWVIYLIQYFLTLTLLFVILSNSNAIYIHDLKFNLYIMIIMVINLLSLAGFPPLIGFIAKYLVIMTVINTNMLLGIVIISISVVSFFIYFTLIRNIVLDESSSISNTSDAWVISYTTWVLIYIVMSGVPSGYLL